MKLRSIFLALFLSFAGVSLAGCWFFGGSDDSGKSVEELKTDATTYIEEANTALEGHTEKPECAEAVTAVAEAQTAVDDINDATTQDEAKGVKDQAKDAKDKAEECAKVEDEPDKPNTKTAALVHFHSGVSEKDGTTDCPADTSTFIPSGEESCSKGGDCVAKAAEWKAAQEGDGYTCTEETKERTSRLAVCPPVQEVIYTCTKTE